MHQHANAEQDRRVALGWIGRQLAWETRLEKLRDDDPQADDGTNADAEEIDSAA
jgi:hypothetical protein